MERWFAIPDGQHSRKGLWEAIKRFGGSYDPERHDVRSLKGEIEKDTFVFEIAPEGVEFLDQSVRDGEQWKFRFFRKRNEIEMVVEQKIKKVAPEKIRAMERRIQVEKKKKGR